MKFGNWNVTEDGIEWAQSLQRFVIEKRQLLDKSQYNGDRADMYKWLLLATDEDWLTHDDLYDLNFAFVYAAANAGADFEYEVFDRTVGYQYELLDDEEETQPALGDLSADDAEAEQKRKEALSERD